MGENINKLIFILSLQKKKCFLRLKVKFVHLRKKHLKGAHPPTGYPAGPGHWRRRRRSRTNSTARTGTAPPSSPASPPLDPATAQKTTPLAIIKRTASQKITAILSLRDHYGAFVVGILVCPSLTRSLKLNGAGGDTYLFLLFFSTVDKEIPS